MSCEIFNHIREVKSSDCETDTDFTYTISDLLKTCGQDDRFYLFGEHSSQMGGTVRTSINLSAAEAQKLKVQLEEFIALNPHQ